MEEKMDDLFKEPEIPGQSGSLDSNVANDLYNADMRFVNLIVKIIVNATIRECDEESNQVPEIQ